MIRLENVYKEYRPGIPVLNRVNLTLQRGDFAIITGRSGAGKSTLLKLLFASEKPNDGSVFVAGTDISKLKGEDLPYFRRKVGVIYQDFKLLPRRTVFENVAFTLEVLGRPRREIHTKVPAVLRQLGLEAYSNQLPTLLSGGEQQRVAIARAIVREPQILIADEPTGNLDPKMAQEIFSLFRKINRRGTTIIIATHSLELIERDPHPKRLFQIENGDIIERDFPVY